MQSLRFWEKHQQDGSPKLRPPVFLKFRSNKNFIVCAVAMAIFTVCILYYLATYHSAMGFSFANLGERLVGYFSLWIGTMPLA